MKRLTDIEEIIDGLRKAGYDAVKIDDSLPLYDVKVKCGSPSELGYVQKVMMQTPSMLRDAGAEFGVTAMGESMIDCNVEEGDFLWIDTRAAINDCDVVLARLNGGEYTVKSFFRDMEDRPWLLPANDKYNPIALNEENSPQVIGKVARILKADVKKMPARLCQKKLNAWLKAERAKKAFTREQVIDIIRSMAGMVENVRQWYSVYKPLEDASAIDKKSYGDFVVMVREAVPEHEKLPNSGKEISCMAVQSFAKPVAEWRDGYAPVQGKRFNDYVLIAQKTMGLLK